MKIGNKTHVSLSYTLTVDGQVVETVTAEHPLSFLFGVGQLLPSFEANIIGKEVGDDFAFRLEAAEAYGEHRPEYVFDLPMDMFKQDGKIVEGVLFEGNRIMLNDRDGNIMPAVITAIGQENVTVDLNPPMAGKALNFEGKVVAVREATDEDFMQQMAAAGGCSCGCHGECNDGCDGGCDGGCEGGCEGGCNN